MKKLAKQLISFINEATPAKQAKDAGYKSLGGGYYSKTGQAPAQATTRGGTFRLLSKREKEAMARFPLPGRAYTKKSDTPSVEKPSATKPTAIKSAPVDIKSAAMGLPGSKGVVDAIQGITTVGSAGAGTPESRAAEASVVLISNYLLQGRKKFKGTMDEYLSQNDAVINNMIGQLTSMKGSKLTQDWHKSVKAQIIASLSKTEKMYGKIDSLVWDNAEGRVQLGLPKSKDMNDRSDMYFRTSSGEVIGVSLKKSGRIFLANQGYSKIISKIESFTEDSSTKAKIQKLKKLHKAAADEAFVNLSAFIKKNKSSVTQALSKFNRTGVKSLSSPKYDEYFTPSGAPTKQFLGKITSGQKLSSNEFKALLKCMDGVKKQNPQIKVVMDGIRKVDIQATKQFLYAVESDQKIREATTRYLLDALDIPQMMSMNPSEGISHAVTVYGEGNIDDNGDPIPMYVNGETLRETFGISKNANQEQALDELRTRFIIDAESDKRVGMIRLRITNKTPPPNYYYPTIASLALRARGLGAAAAFELYQHESWTYTLASKSPNPENWSEQQRKKHAQSTMKFLQDQIKNPLVSKKEKDQMRKDIEFYSKMV
jgi:hypothetical protein